MSKRPSFQFYPSDWLGERGLRLCSMAARGLWADLLCVMHDGVPYGHLADENGPLSPAEIGKLVGEKPAIVRRLMDELAARGVFSTQENGVIFSRRMVRDEAVREARAQGGIAGAIHGVKGTEHGAKGGRPRSETPVTRGDNKPPLEPPPSSSSSSSSSEDKEANASLSGQPSLALDGGQADLAKTDPWANNPEFKAAWDACPPKARTRSSKRAAWAEWQKAKRRAPGVDFAAAMRRYAAGDDDAQRGFAPGFHLWLKADKFEHWVTEAAAKAAAAPKEQRQTYV